MFKKILIANRGEIAVRVMRACREMEIQTVAVYSDVDRGALHVQFADEAVGIGEAPPLQSYLNIDRIIEAAKSRGADAVHPGYGFLAENHTFAARCIDEGLVFIGPSPESMKLVGDKVAARKTLSSFDVPLIPGMKSSRKDLSKFHSAAEKIGYPVMLKAAAGGGGKGMRIVHGPGDLKAAVEAGRREAQSAFGDASVYLEKCIEEPRHIEFQVLADSRGNAIHAFERECSIQRRHQKIVEETPSTALDEDLRQRMGRAAVEVVRATGYTNAGTVEFLLDKDKKFYFLEVNARIQVEHPVTEMVTGLDLVKWQIRIASGESLIVTQEDLRQRGHAIECRIYAEDPANGFLPSLGTIQYMQEPYGPGVRVDSGIFSGYEVSRHYDPILSKLIVWGEDRESSRRRMVQALSEYAILGIRTPMAFLKDVMETPDFIEGRTTTAFLAKNMSGWEETRGEEAFKSALIAAALCEETEQRPTGGRRSPAADSPWKRLGAWRLGNR